MTNDQLKREVMYQAAMSPFRKLLDNQVISEEDFRVIDTIMRCKYAPLFCGHISPESLDIKTPQR